MANYGPTIGGVAISDVCQQRNDMLAALKLVRGHLTARFVDTDGAVRQYVKALLVIEDAIAKAEGR